MLKTILAKKTVNKEVKLWHIILISPLMAGAFLIGSWMFGNAIGLTLNGVNTEAEVIDVVVTRDDDGTKYQPTFSFEDTSGKTHTKETLMSSSTPYEKGQIVDVVYYEDTPLESAKINSFFELWFLPLLLLFISIITELGLIFGYKAQQKPGYKKVETSHSPLLLGGKKITSRYWQTIRENGQRRVEVQYVYENTSYKTRSQPLDDKQLKKLVPGEEITVRVNPRSPDEAIVMI